VAGGGLIWSVRYKDGKLRMSLYACGCAFALMGVLDSVLAPSAARSREQLAADGQGGW